MLFKWLIKENPQEKLAEKIKIDLVSTFQRKNIKVAKINVDMKYGNVNLEVLISEQQY